MSRLIKFLFFSALVSFAYSYPLEDENGEELELVQLVPVRRFPRGVGVGQIQGQGQGQGQVMMREGQGPAQRPYYQQQRPSRNQMGYRQTQTPQGMQQYDPLMSSPSHREPLVAAETGHGGHSPYEYVDYGAYTGGYGAFGWYSDHPVQTGGHY